MKYKCVLNLPKIFRPVTRNTLIFLFGPIKIEFLSQKIVFVLANSVHPDEMPHYAENHLGLHCLPKNLERVNIFMQ